jgi:hypothetical protein
MSAKTIKVSLLAEGMTSLVELSEVQYSIGGQMIQLHSEGLQHILDKSDQRQPKAADEKI